MSTPMQTARTLSTTQATAAVDRVGELRFLRVGDQTVVERCFATSPLRLLLPRNHGRAAWAFSSTFGGGFVDGDDVRLSVDVGDGASAMLGTQASTKVFPGKSSQSLHVDVGRDALFVGLADPLVPFAGARFCQSTTLSLHESASALWVEQLHGGRIARGERWLFSALDARLSVRQSEQVVLEERVLLDDALLPIAPRMHGYTAMATIVMAGPQLASHARQWLEGWERETITRDMPVVEAVMPRSDGTWMVRMMATRPEELAQTLRRRLAFVAELLRDDAFARKW